MLRYSTGLLISLLLCACATTPDVTYTYHLATTQTAISLTQTVGCNAAGNELLITYSAPTATTTNLADTSREGTFSIPIHQMDSAFADTDIGVTLSDDGRLKGINASSTGQGSTILKSLITATTTVVGLTGGGMFARMHQLGHAPARTKSPECQAIDATGGKTVAIAYYGAVNLANEPANTDVALNPVGDQTTQALYNRLRLGTHAPVLVRIDSRAEVPVAATYNGPTDAYKYWVTLQQPLVVQFSVHDSGCHPAFYTATTIVPGPHTYTLPLPNAAFFGSQKLVLAVSDDGAITGVEYAKTSGTSGLTDVIGTIPSK